MWRVVGVRDQRQHLRLLLRRLQIHFHSLLRFLLWTLLLLLLPEVHRLLRQKDLPEEKPPWLWG